MILFVFLVVGHLDCFNFLTVANNAVMNITVQIIRYIYVHTCLHPLRSRISEVSCILSRNCLMLLQNVNSYICQTVYESSTSPHYMLNNNFFPPFNFSHPSVCA